MCWCNPAIRTPWCGKAGCRVEVHLDGLTAATRPQPPPEVHDGPCIQDLVIADIEARKLQGLQKYGTLLQPFNGRDALTDAYQEALDLAQYLRQAIEERRLISVANGDEKAG